MQVRIAIASQESCGVGVKSPVTEHPQPFCQALEQASRSLKVNAEATANRR